jgi:hypothetical protein
MYINIKSNARFLPWTFKDVFRGRVGIKIKINFYFSPFLTITSISG